MAAILTIALSFPNIAQAIELKGFLNTNQLKVTNKPWPSGIKVLNSNKCGPGTQSLELTFSKITLAQATALSDKIQINNPKFQPCDNIAFHDDQGNFKVVFSYKNKGQQNLKIQTAKNESFMVIDHWFGSSKPKGQVKRLPGSEAPKVAHSNKNITIQNLNDLSKITNIELRSFGNIESPYKDPKIEKDIKLKNEPLRVQALKTPFLELNRFKHEIEFTEEPFPFKEFQLSKLNISSQLKKSLDAIVDMAKREDWIRANAAADILVKSKLSKEYKDLGFFSSALSGYLKVKASQQGQEKQDILFNAGISQWREALLKQSVERKAADSYLNFIYLESLRNLFLNKDYYSALAVVDDAKNIQWPNSVLERSEYLQAVALMSLGMYQKSKAAFQKYIEKRKHLNIKDVSDRRILPYAAFRLGDIEYINKNFDQALKEYKAGFNFLPGTNKVNFEGYIYPRQLANMPHVLFQMAEAHRKLGQYSKALKRLRALISFDVVGKHHGIALYRIGEILDYLGADPTKTLSVFRECSYRFSGYFSGSLCDVRSEVLEPRNQQKRLWPRLEFTFLNFEKGDFKVDSASLSEEDRKMFSALLRAEFYIQNKKPKVALSVLDKVRDLESSKYLKDWNYEFSSTALLGVFRDSFETQDLKSIVQIYEKRKNNLLLNVERPDLSFAIASSYAELGLWGEAQKSLNRALELNDLFGTRKQRPFDYITNDWQFLEAKIKVGLYSEKRLLAEEVKKSLKSLSQKDERNLNLLIYFSKISKDLNLEQLAWSKLEELKPLTWVELRDYTSALMKNKKSKQLRQVLEDYVGTWFYNKDKSSFKIEDSPKSALLYRLAESRLESGAIDSGLRVLEYLSRQDNLFFDSDYPKDMVLYNLGKVYASKKNYNDARRSFDAAISLSPSSLWGKLSATENQMLKSDVDDASAR